jgi:hypothetical protein
VANANRKAPALVIEPGLPVSALAGWLPTGPFAARAHLRKICPIPQVTAPKTHRNPRKFQTSV